MYLEEILKCIFKAVSDGFHRDGFKLFCNPFARRVKPHQMDYLQTGISDKINLESTALTKISSFVLPFSIILI